MYSSQLDRNLSYRSPSSQHPPLRKMIITDVFPFIVKIIKYCMVLFAVVEYAKGFVSEAESTDPADRDVTIERRSNALVFIGGNPNHPPRKNHRRRWLP